MNRPFDPAFDQRLADWLEDDPSTAPREVLGTVLAAFPSIDQRRATRVPWRNPLMNRYSLPLAAALVVVIGAYLISRPTSQVGPGASPSPALPTIEGTWDVTYTRQDMLAASPDPSEDDPSNYGHFHLTFLDGRWAMAQLAPQQSFASSTYTTGNGVAHIYSAVDNVTFDVPYTVTSTTLTFGGGGPVGLRVKPWTRIATEPIPTVGPTPSPLSASPGAAVGTADVGKTLRAGTYRIGGFAVPFSVTLPDGWAINELTPTSVAIGSTSSANVNLFMTTVNKAYADPCRPSATAKPVVQGVDALVTALSAMKNFTVSGVQTATVGGATGKTFLFSNAINGSTAGCAANPMPFVTRANGAGDFDITVFGGETDQFWVVDAGGTTVLIAVTSNFVDTVRPVVDSLSFGT